MHRPLPRRIYRPNRQVSTWNDYLLPPKYVSHLFFTPQKYIVFALSLKTMFSCAAHTAPTLACIADGIETLPRSLLNWKIPRYFNASPLNRLRSLPNGLWAPPPPSLHISQAKYIVKAIISSSYFHVSSPFQTTRGVLCDSSKWLSNKDFLDPGDERASLAYWPLPDQRHLCHFSQVIFVTMAKFSVETTFMTSYSKE